MKRFFTALALLAVALASHARAQIDEQLGQLAAQLVGLGASEPAESSLELNGARLDLTTLTLSGSVQHVLQRFDTLCSPATARAALQAQTPDGALALCLVQPQGELRYLRVRRLPKGAVHVLFAHSRGPLPLEAMFPGRGDAAGGDIAELPRPAVGRRVLTTKLPGSGHALVAYEVPGTPGAALAAYARSLQQHGFMQLEVAGATETRAFSRGSELLVVHGRSQNGQSVLSAVRLGSAQLPAAGIALAEQPEQRD